MSRLSDAREELFERHMTRMYTLHWQSDPSTRGSPPRQSKGKNRGVSRAKKSAHRTPRPVATRKNRRDDRGTEVGIAGPSVQRSIAPNFHEQQPRMSMYNMTTISPTSFWNIPDATLSNGEVDPTLAELARIVEEERLREDQWWAHYRSGQEPEPWVYPGSFKGMSTSTHHFISRALSSAGANSMLYLDEMSWTPIGDIALSEAKLNEIFYEYFNVEQCE